MPDAVKPKVFIGSSSQPKSRNVADAVRAHLDKSDSCEVTVWTDGIFTIGQGSLDALNRAADQFDFAIMVFAPDDAVMTTQGTGAAPRDNVLFELGLFMGRLGPDRTFYISDKDDKVKIPTDFSGVTEAFFRSRSDGNLQAAVAPACKPILDQIRKLGTVEQQPAFSELAKNCQRAFKIDNVAFQEEVRFRFGDWSSEAEQWARGTVRVSENYNDMLLRVYEQAKKSIFSTSIPMYRRIWNAELGRRILHHQKENGKAKSTRVFIFDKKTDMLDEDRKIFDEHLKHNVEVLLFFDSETGHFTFPPDLGNDWTIIDEGEVIGVTLTAGSVYEATWYFNDARQKSRFRRFETGLRRLSEPYGKVVVAQAKAAGGESASRLG